MLAKTVIWTNENEYRRCGNPRGKEVRAEGKIVFRKI
jgi:hypothetical protein